MAATERHCAAARTARTARPTRPRAPTRGPGATRARSSTSRAVTKVYDGGHVGLDRASFAVTPGEFVFLVGSTGLGQVDDHAAPHQGARADVGTIRVAGRDLAAITRSRVPLLPPQHRAWSTRTSSSCPTARCTTTSPTPCRSRAARGATSARRCPTSCASPGLSTKLHNFPDQLSGGEQQRVSVARAFVNHPPLLLADEPTGNLDPETSIGIMQLLYRINRTGTTVIVATHDHVMVDKMRRRVIELAGGRVIRDQPVGRYREDESTREFAARLRSDTPSYDPRAW
jgi:cell division transport system ATP-binding protein